LALILLRLHPSLFSRGPSLNGAQALKGVERPGKEIGDIGLLRSFSFSFEHRERIVVGNLRSFLNLFFPPCHFPGLPLSETFDIGFLPDFL